MRALAFSGGKDSMACLHLLHNSLDCAIYVDTGFAYPETLALVDYARGLVPLEVVRSDRAAQNALYGLPADVVPVNWTALGQAMTSKKPVMVQSYLECCYANIVQPLWAAAKRLGVTELVFGERAEENHRSTSRDGDMVEGIRRLHPIEGWTEARVMDYLRDRMEIPAHYAVKHSSLDCFDCTGFASDSSDRVQWTKEKHPEYHAAYAARAAALAGALKEALHG